MKEARDRRKRAARDGAAIAAAIMLLAWALAWVVPLPARMDAEPARYVLDRSGLPLYAELAPDGRWRLPVAVEEVDPAFVRALLGLEDRRFRWHLGVDLPAIARAALGNAVAGAVRSGGSTLTMQWVRLLEPRPRTLRSKLIEALRAVQIELRLPKSRVLTGWLSLAPFGRNIEGVEAGAIATYGHRATALDPVEIVTLLAIPQDPTDRHASSANAGRLAAARRAVGGRLLAASALRAQDGTPIDASTLDRWLQASPVPARLRALPKDARHAATFLLEQASVREGRRVARVRSTLDAHVQREVERRMVAERGSLGRRGIHNGAAIVVDRTSSEVRALVGNLDFWDSTHAGQIAAFDVPRSPGSALKPVLYALGADRGLLLPQQLTPDVPTRFGGYAPRNYDGGWTGLVRWEQALSRSLNMPFVSLLHTMGLSELRDRFRAVGLARPWEGGPYGLSVAVGGIELSLIELAALYRAIAEDGLFVPLRFDSGAPAVAGTPLSSPEAAWFVRRALSLRDRPDFPQRAALRGAPRGIHWKTGTSAGRRDAWALGSGPVFTAGVWLGNLDQRGSSALSGADAAAPLLFDLLESIEPGHPPPPDDPPAGFGLAWTCSWSGFPVGPHCPQRSEAMVILDRVPAQTCPWHRRVEVDSETGQQIGPGCRDGRVSVERTFVVLPGPVRRYLAATGQAVPSPPDPAPGCAPSGRGGPPQMVSPVDGHTVLLLPGLPAEDQQVPLFAEGEGELAWFVDGTWLGHTAPGERWWWTPSVGTHEIVVADAVGRRARRAVEVRPR